MADGTDSFDQALQQLEDQVATLEKGDVTLDDALRAYEQGVGAANACLEHLRTAELRIDEVELDEALRV